MLHEMSLKPRMYRHDLSLKDIITIAMINLVEGCQLAEHLWIDYAVLAALVMKFFFDKYNFTSGGALGSLTLGLVIKELWARGWPSFACVEGTHFLFTCSCLDVPHLWKSWYGDHGSHPVMHSQDAIMHAIILLGA